MSENTETKEHAREQILNKIKEASVFDKETKRLRCLVALRESVSCKNKEDVKNLILKNKDELPDLFCIYKTVWGVDDDVQ